MRLVRSVGFVLWSFVKTLGGVVLLFAGIFWTPPFSWMVLLDINEDNASYKITFLAINTLSWFCFLIWCRYKDTA